MDSQLGLGSSFHIYLPAVDEGVKPAAGVPDQKQDKIGGSGRILIMDDEEMIRNLLVSMLEYMGYEAVVSSNGREALTAYKKAMQHEKPFAAVIMDLTIPGGKGGKDTIEELLQLDSEARVIVSSGYSNDPVMANYKQYGFHGAIIKPYKLDELARILKEVLPQSSGQETEREVREC